MNHSLALLDVAWLAWRGGRVSATRSGFRRFRMSSFVSLSSRIPALTRLRWGRGFPLEAPPLKH